MQSVLVFFPTYNEAGNVEALIEAIRRHLPSAHLLVVDDASPDGTGDLLDDLAWRIPQLTVVHRPGKLGLGSAHKIAMLHARDNDYDRLITMDADFSHHPRYLAKFLELLDDADFVTGSRYVAGGACDYGPDRMFISRTANLFAKAALGLPLAENTTMYRGFTRELLQKLDIEAIKSEGYSFAVESLRRVAQVTDRLAEFPIHFENRAAGSSKISKAEIYRAVLTIQRLGLERLLKGTGTAPSLRATERVACRACQNDYHVEIYPARDGGRDTALDASPYSCASHSSRSHGQILKCLRCGLVFMRPQLDAPDLVNAYADAVDATYWKNIDARVTTFQVNLDRIRHHIRPGARVLEVGSYCGAFLKVARDAGIDIVGVEPSRWAVERSREFSDAPVHCGTVDDLPGDMSDFDVIIAWDVLEHFHDPVKELAKLNRLLRDGGTLLFSTLMIDNWFPRLLGRHWPWLMDMHLFYFTEESIRHVLSNTGYHVLEDDKYTHVITLAYLFEKLGTLGIAGASGLSRRFSDTTWGAAQIPFRFGDIKLFACRKVAEIAPTQASRVTRASEMSPPASDEIEALPA